MSTPTTPATPGSSTFSAQTPVAPDPVSQLPKEEQDALKASVFQRLRPRAYFERFVAEGVRPDGREFDEWRDVHLNVGSISTADGSSLVRLGHTTIVCGVKAEVAEPELDRPNEGFLVPNIDLPALCSPKFKPGPPGEEAQVLSDKLNEVLVTSNILPLESLCIYPGKAVWVIYLDAMCINYDGNALDAALIAAVAALKNTRVPEAKFDEESGETTCVRGGPTVPLQIGSSPVCMSFGIFDSTHIISDPTSFEEPLLDTSISVVLDAASSQLISVSQLGLGTTSVTAATTTTTTGQSALLSCIASAKKRLNEIKTKLI